MKDQPFTLRPAEAEEATAIRILILQSGINPTGLKWPRFVLAVDANSRLIGCVQLKPHRDGSTELASLAVKPKWQGQGVARALIEHMLGKHPGPLYLMCRSSLGPFYGKFGFRSVEVEAMPRYFRRISRLVKLIEPLRENTEKLLVMRRA